MERRTIPLVIRSPSGELLRVGDKSDIVLSTYSCYWSDKRIGKKYKENLVHKFDEDLIFYNRAANIAHIDDKEWYIKKLRDSIRRELPLNIIVKKIRQYSSRDFRYPTVSLMLDSDREVLWLHASLIPQEYEFLVMNTINNALLTTPPVNPLRIC